MELQATKLPSNVMFVKTAERTTPSGTASVRVQSLGVI